MSKIVEDAHVALAAPKLFGFIPLSGTSERASERIHRVFTYLYRRRHIAELVFAAVYFLLLKTADYLTDLHKPVIAPTQMAMYSSVTSAIAFVVGIVVTGVPMMLVGAHERRRIRIMTRLSEALYETAERQPGTALPSLAGTCERIIETVRAGGTRLYVLTPNLLYLNAKTLVQYTDGPEHAELRKALIEIAEHEGPFHDALETFRGTLYFLVPDPNDEEVRSHFRLRADALRLDQSIVLHTNAKAVKLIRELQRVRRAAGRQTHLLLINRAPAFRFMLSDRRCFIQALPRGQAGILQDAREVLQTEGMSYTVIEGCIKALADIV